MIRAIKIEKLFNLFNHEINFFENGNLTIIVGQNGLGKTAVLKIIKSIFERDLIGLSNILFYRIEIVFVDDSKLVICKEHKKSEDVFPNDKNLFDEGNLDEQNSEERILDDDKELVFSYISPNGNVEGDFNFSIYSEHFDKFKRGLARSLPIFIREQDNNEWYDRRNDIIYTLNELLTVYKKVIPRRVLSFEGLPNWYLAKSEEIKVFFIETQRLLTSVSYSEITNVRNHVITNLFTNSIEEYSNDLARLINRTLAKGTEVSAKLDRSYPERLFAQFSLNNVSEEGKFNFEKKLKELEDKRQILSKTGLIELNSTVDFSMIKQNINAIQNESLSNVLNIYIEDSNTKLDVYNELANKISLLLEIINKRFLKKKLSITKQDGFVFRSTERDNVIIPLTSLSSGEQHIIVLYYQLLFKVTPGTLLLLDEPEISLHLEWQNNVINDLEEISKYNPMNMIVTTHSPSIIGDNWDKTIQLKAN